MCVCCYMVVIMSIEAKSQYYQETVNVETTEILLLQIATMEDQDFHMEHKKPDIAPKLHACMSCIMNHTS